MRYLILCFLVYIPSIFAKDTCINVNKEDEITSLACAIYFEAGNQGSKGQELVGNVILNRLHHPKFPDSLNEVLNQPNQFAFTHRNKKPVLYKDNFISSYRVALVLWFKDKFNFRKDISNNSYWFHTVKSLSKCRYGKRPFIYKEHIFCSI